MPLLFVKEIQDSLHLAVWKISENLNDLENLLSENLEYNDIKHPQKKIEFICSRLCIQELCQALNINYQGIDKDDCGKPYLINSTWQISISHSTSLVAVVFHPTKSIGIDVEKPSEKLKKVAHKFLSPSEMKATENHLDKLCIYWSAKEALYKLYGKRKVIFNENLSINKFPEGATATVGSIEMESFKNHYSILIDKIDDYYLVIAH